MTRKKVEEDWKLSHGNYFFPHIQMKIPHNKNVRQLLWQFQYVDTAEDGCDFYCYNREGNRNPVVSQASCRMDNDSTPSTSLTADCGRFEGLLCMSISISIVFLNYL